MISGDEIVGLSRLQFGLTAMYHFLFVPLTLGLSFLLASILKTAVDRSISRRSPRKTWLSSEQPASPGG